VKTSDFVDFDEALLQSSKDRNWLLFGLMISLAFHGALCGYFYKTSFMSAKSVLEQQVQTPTFKVKNVDLQPLDKASLDQLNPAAKPEPDKTDVQLPDEKKSFDQLLQEVHSSSALPDDTRDVLPDKPQVDANASSVLKEIEATTAQTLAKSPNATREQNLLMDSANSGRPQPALTGTELATSTTIKKPNTFTSKLPGDSAGPNVRHTPGFSDLDSLLAQKGPLGAGTKPILLPENQTFGYDSAILEPGAAEQLQKLGKLMQRNPKASFMIEGYTDSFGSPDYNIDLSQRRADAVKDYLISVMRVSPAQIQTRGFGATRFLVAPRPIVDPAQEEFEIRRQQPNRRVVVVVHTDE
jgi:outer membrane protein OmpA-like peptidoglycan-associated protein